MAGIITEDYATEGRYSLSDGMSSQSGDSIAEWRSSEQVENGTPSTSPPFWDIDDEDDSGLKPSELYGKFTWKIENFPQINKRELRSNAFEVGGYKWYILIYPQGCDVCNHLSLFLCVANHDKLLPGWSHFAQFTIAVVNKEPKKSKYSDTLHRFWKKEHDWGWKKFMELSKVSDGFIVNDTLVIKAQVQVIREKANRPFRCLDRQYRRELVRVYLSNVEQICWRFVEERRGKICKLIEDRLRWSSFRAFWVGIDQNARHCMSRDKTEMILKDVVKHFFIEKEVTSTLVMDSLYSGLKALECQSKNKNAKAKLVELEEFPPPMVLVEKDMLVLADDVVKLLEKLASEPLPHHPLPSKDDKGLRTKDANSGDEFNKDIIERDERRLTELGRRTVEIYVLAHIFSSRIETAYQNDLSLKRQEELIKEEAAGLAENELKAKREKEKRTKKKQAKQKRSSRKAKDKVRDEKSNGMMQEIPSDEISVEYPSSEQAEVVLDKIQGQEDASDVSDSGGDVAGVLQPVFDGRDGSNTICYTDTPEVQLETNSCEVHNGQAEKRGQPLLDDSSSTCSSDTIPLAVTNEINRANLLSNKKKSQSSPKRGKALQGKDMYDQAGFTDGKGNGLPSNPSNGSAHSCDVIGSSNQPELEMASLSKDQRHRHDQHPLEKDAHEKKSGNLKTQETMVTLQKRLGANNQADLLRPSDSKALDRSASLSPGKKLTSVTQQKLLHENTTTASTTTITTTMAETLYVGGPSNVLHSSEKSTSQATRAAPLIPSTPRSEPQKISFPPKSFTVPQSPSLSRPFSAPLNPGPKPMALTVSTVQAAPVLSRSVSAAGRLGNDPSPTALSYSPQSYRNATIGRNANVVSPSGLPPPSLSSSSSQAISFSQVTAALLSSVPISSHSSLMADQTSAARPGITFGSVKPEVLPIRQPARDDSSCQPSTGNSSSRGGIYNSSPVTDIERFSIYELQNKQSAGSSSIPSVASSRQAPGILVEEFPHLDIINDLLDEEQSTGNTMNSQHYDYHHLPFSRQYSLPGNLASMEMSLADGGGHIFDHTAHYYDDTSHRAYRSGLLDATRLQQADTSAYPNGQIDGLIQNQWPYSTTDLSMLNMASTDANEYGYHLPDYLNLSRGVNGHPRYRS